MQCGRALLNNISHVHTPPWKPLSTTVREERSVNGNIRVVQSALPATRNRLTAIARCTKRARERTTRPESVRPGS